MKATKGNKVYTITEEQRKFYLDAGYDIIDDEGKVIKYGKGKTVPYAEYAAVKKELDELKSAKEPKEPEGPEKDDQEPGKSEKPKKPEKAAKKQGEAAK